MLCLEFQEIKRRIQSAAQRVNRPGEDIKLLAVTKTRSPEVVRDAYGCGQYLFGENYIQEAASKLSVLEDLRPFTRWHFIGHLQRNKARTAAELFDRVETLDSIKLARALDKYSRACGKLLSVLIQVNIAGDPAKSGLAPGELPGFLEKVMGFENLRVEGLMTLPPWSSEAEGSRRWFRALYELREKMVQEFGEGCGLKELSMGMTHDFEVAIEEGATTVRIGTALFGPRK